MSHSMKPALRGNLFGFRASLVRGVVDVCRFGYPWYVTVEALRFALVIDCRANAED